MARASSARTASPSPLTTTATSALARVFTGLAFGNNTDFNLWPRDFTVPMKCWDDYHDCNNTCSVDCIFRRARPAQQQRRLDLADVIVAVSNLFAHPNVGPFIRAQLSNGSSPQIRAGYVARVAAAFANSGGGVRGDMKAVVASSFSRSRSARSRDDEPTHVGQTPRTVAPGCKSGPCLQRRLQLQVTTSWMSSPSITARTRWCTEREPASSCPHGHPGPITQMGLVAPSFVINASTAITGPNYFWDDAILGGLHVGRRQQLRCAPEHHERTRDDRFPPTR